MLRPRLRLTNQGETAERRSRREAPTEDAQRIG